MAIEPIKIQPILTALGIKQENINYCLPYLCGEKKPTPEQPQNASEVKDDEKARLITLTEAGKRLGYSRTTIWRLAKAGTLPVVNPTGIGNNRVRLADVIALSSGKRA